jgi:hypothetical protein
MAAGFISGEKKIADLLGEGKSLDNLHLLTSFALFPYRSFLSTWLLEARAFHHSLDFISILFLCRALLQKFRSAKILLTQFCFMSL